MFNSEWLTWKVKCKLDMKGQKKIKCKQYKGRNSTPTIIKAKNFSMSQGDGSLVESNVDLANQR